MKTFERINVFNAYLCDILQSECLSGVALARYKCAKCCLVHKKILPMINQGPGLIEKTSNSQQNTREIQQYTTPE